MKKIITLIVILIISITLISCKKVDYTEYAGTYVLSSQSFANSDNQEIFPFTIYEIELFSNGKANHKLKLNIMPEVENMSNTFTINKDLNMIIFKNVIDYMNTYTEKWTIKDNQIIMEQIEVAITSDPDPSEKDDYTIGTVILTKQQ